MILCRPAVAGAYGAIFGVLMLLPGAGERPKQPDPPGPDTQT
ncbi:MAG: hypothetical protein QM765_42345 [Myxococcales bacterium]